MPCGHVSLFSVGSKKRFLLPCGKLNFMSNKLVTCRLLLLVSCCSIHGSALIEQIYMYLNHALRYLSHLSSLRWSHNLVNISTKLSDDIKVIPVACAISKAVLMMMLKLNSLYIPKCYFFNQFMSVAVYIECDC